MLLDGMQVVSGTELHKVLMVARMNRSLVVEVDPQSFGWTNMVAVLRLKMCKAGIHT